jgi:4-alpha-glucanotransferase
MGAHTIFLPSVLRRPTLMEKRDLEKRALERRESRARAGGILLHPTSLPGPFGIGDLGPDAYRFVDRLVDWGQSIWQTLPLGPTGYGNSPYMCFSAFAANPMLISPHQVVALGLLQADDIAAPPTFPARRVDYPVVVAWKRPLLARAFAAFRDGKFPTLRDEYYYFCEQNAFWLEDYALFRAIKTAHDERPWTDWQPDIARREPDALLSWRNRLAETLNFRKFVQFLAFRQWAQLKQHCHARDVQVIGDMPIYVAHDSADVWAHRELFHLDETGRPTVVAGVPPDYFSATGQRWGNPIYRWDTLEADGFRWWKERFRMTMAQVDSVRIDHFRGLEAYWEIPAAEPTAVNGRWVKAPGDALLEALRNEAGGLPVIAEDLGLITAEVEALRDRFDLPGMRILQMAFGGDPKANDYLPHNHRWDSVVYTATHDHNTSAGWFTAPAGSETTQSESEVLLERQHALRYIATDGHEIHWDMIRAAFASVARHAIFPLQDMLGLGSAHRMNRPGSMGGNWEWRFDWEDISEASGARLLDLACLYGRTPKPVALPEESQSLLPTSAPRQDPAASC